MMALRYVRSRAESDEDCYVRSSAKKTSQQYRSHKSVILLTSLMTACGGPKSKVQFWEEVFLYQNVSDLYLIYLRYEYLYKCTAMYECVMLQIDQPIIKPKKYLREWKSISTHNFNDSKNEKE
uniref:Uncharacterized protein n=1 Tax=Glossina pallidipes TaxID=7398 RepID=A0A1A9ZN10_GLOPL